jgi:hypothetical protein
MILVIFRLNNKSGREVISTNNFDTDLRKYFFRNRFFISPEHFIRHLGISLHRLDLIRT